MLNQWEIILSAVMGFVATSCHCALAKPQLLPYRNSPKKKCFLFFLIETVCTIFAGCFCHPLISKS